MAKKPSKLAKKLPKKDKKSVTGGVVAALKKVAKVVVKKPSSVPAAKSKAVKSKLPPKAKEAPKKIPISAKKEITLKKKSPVATVAGKKLSPVAPTPAPAKALKDKKGKKTGAEILVEVKSPKGIASLAKTEGKKAVRAEGKPAKKRCREPACDNEPLMMAYCRLHYIKNWKRIKRKEAILASGQLNNYVEELVHKYPDKYLEVIRQDLASEKDWSKVVVDLELDSGDDEVVGEEESDLVTESVGSKRDFDDDADSF